jgi:hypothetical protein
LLNKLMGVRCTFEEGEIGLAVKFDVGRHSDSIYPSHSARTDPPAN